jgi:hypothetical protein
MIGSTQAKLLSLFALGTLTLACSTESPDDETSASDTAALTATDGHSADEDARPPHPHRPPQEAFDACKAREVGSSCSVTFGDKSLEGTCHEPLEGTELVCAPKGTRPPRRGDRNAHNMEETLDRLEREIGGS